MTLWSAIPRLSDLGLVTVLKGDRKKKVTKD